MWLLNGLNDDAHTAELFQAQLGSTKGSPDTGNRQPHWPPLPGAFALGSPPPLGCSRTHWLSSNKQDMAESMKRPFWGQRWWLPFYYSPLPSLTLREMPPCWDAAWEIQPVHPRGNQPWMFMGKAAAEAEAPMLWPPDAKNRLTAKDPSAEKDWRQDEKGTTEDEMVAWHHQLTECEFEQTQGDSERQGSLACCSSWSCKQTQLIGWTTPPCGGPTHVRMDTGLSAEPWDD